MIRRFCIAVSYVTALPLAKLNAETSFAGLAKYLPAVGLLIGLLLWCAAKILLSLNLSMLLVSVLITLIWLLITGGLHMDGLMDTADGICSHRDQKRMLEIMHDSRVGNFGVLVGLGVVLIKIACLNNMAATALFSSLLLIPAWARFAQVIAIASYPYAREEGMGKIWHDSTKAPGDLFLGAILPLLVTGVLCYIDHSLSPLFAALFAVIAGSLAAWRLNSILGGQTGDTYGAIAELAEAGALLLLSLLPATWLSLPPI